MVGETDSSLNLVTPVSNCITERKEFWGGGEKGAVIKVFSTLWKKYLVPQLCAWELTACQAQLLKEYFGFLDISFLF